MNIEKENTLKETEKKGTYTIPVLLVGVTVILLTVLTGWWGIRNAAQVKEIDPATIATAKNEALALVPAENPGIKENIETALLENQVTDQPVDLNLKNPFLQTVGPDAKVPVAVPPGKILPPVSISTPTPKIQLGANNNNSSYGKNSGLTATKLPDRNPGPTLPTFESRYRVWEQQYALAQKNQLAEPKIGQIYATSEVSPVGVIEANERKIVNFVVNQTDQAGFSLEKGERLYDALVSEVTAEGVLYTLDDGSQKFSPYLEVRNSTGTRKSGTGSTTPNSVQPNSPIGQLSDGNSDKSFFLSDSKETLPNLNFLMAALNESDFVYPKQGNSFEKQTDPDYFHQPPFIADDKLSLITSEKLKESFYKKYNGSVCDPNFVGDTIRYRSRANLTLYEFLRNMQDLFNVSFVIDKEVPDDEVVISVSDKPWNYVLEIVLRSKNLEARCQVGDIVSIEPKGKQVKVDQENQKAEPTYSLPYPIQYLPLSGGASVQITGSTGGSNGGNGGNGNGGSGFGIGIESQLQSQLRAIDPRASVVRVANTSSLSVTTTAKGHEEVVKFLENYDKPGFQVQIETNFYTVNDSLLTDIGGQFSAIIGNPAGNVGGGITNLPPAQTTTGTGTGTGTGSTNTSPNFPALPGVGNPTDALRAGSANTLFGARFTIGSATFNALISAAENKGLANVQSRTTQTTLNGGTAEISAGDTIILPTTALGGGGLVNAGAITINATQSARIQPQVATDKDGNPIAVTLVLQLTNNSINRALSGGAAPVVATQTQSTTVRLALDETFVIGGFFTDAVVNTRNRTPGISKVPGLGELFKRRVNQVDRNRLYFAITVRVVRDTALPATPAPTDIDTRPVPAPAPQTPGVRESKMNADKKTKKSDEK